MKLCQKSNLLDYSCRKAYNLLFKDVYEYCEIEAKTKKLFMNVLKTAEIEKKNKYGPACEEKHMSFTPLVTSIDGVLAPEFTFFLKRLPEGLASKWDRPYSHVMCWVRCRISFAILRATNICIRGTRSKWRSLGVEDGYTI